MEIKVNSKFEIGEIRKCKGSTTQKFLIKAIIIDICEGGIQIKYNGLMLVKKDKISAIADWSRSDYKKEPEEIWEYDKEGILSEIVLE